jgi:hypothetical protein
MRPDKIKLYDAQGWLPSDAALHDQDNLQNGSVGLENPCLSFDTSATTEPRCSFLPSTETSGLGNLDIFSVYHTTASVFNDWPDSFLHENDPTFPEAVISWPGSEANYNLHNGGDNLAPFAVSYIPGVGTY